MYIFVSDLNESTLRKIVGRVKSVNIDSEEVNYALDTLLNERIANLDEYFTNQQIKSLMKDGKF